MATAAASEADVRRAFKNVDDVDLGADAEMLAMLLALSREHSLSGDDLATQWEIVAMNYARLDRQGLVRKLKDSVAKNALAAAASSSSSSTSSSRPDSQPRRRRGELPPTSPVMTTRTLKRLPGTHGIGGSSAAGRITLMESKKRVRLERPAGMGAAEGMRTPERQARPMPPRDRDCDEQSLTSKSPICSKNGFAERTNMGKVELTFNGDVEFAARGALDEDAAAMAGTQVRVVAAIKPYQYMYATLEQRGDALEDQLEHFAALFLQRLGLEEDDLAPVGAISQTPVLVVARVCCEATKGKLNAKSLVLEGSRASCNGARVKLDAEAHLSGFAFFPGQIVAVRGVCPSGDVFFAQELFSSLKPPPAKTGAAALEKFYLQKAASPPVLVVAAAGPYTTQGDLEYEPLEDLLANIVETRPDVVVLMGPFVDADHEMVSSGNCFKLAEDGAKVSLTFQEVMDLVTHRISSALEDAPGTRVVLCPSTKDVTHHVAYPQPPLDVKGLKRPGGARAQVMVAPNPCTLQVNELLIGVNAQDTILHLAQDEVARVDPALPKQGRLERLAAHMIHQRSFYPVFPPSPEAALELTQRQGLAIETQPDVMLLSSKLKHFVVDAAGTLCVNPGKLTRGRTGGMFAKMYVNPPSFEKKAAEEGEEKAADGEDLFAHEIVKRTKVEIVRI